jgi:hypothetical protein
VLDELHSKLVWEKQIIKERFTYKTFLILSMIARSGYQSRMLKRSVVLWEYDMGIERGRSMKSDKSIFGRKIHRVYTYLGVRRGK